MEIAQYWVVEFSVSQQSFHVHQVDEMLATNLRTINTGVDSMLDFVPIAFAKSHEEATKLRRAFQVQRDELLSK